MLVNVDLWTSRSQLSLASLRGQRTAISVLLLLSHTTYQWVSEWSSGSDPQQSPLITSVLWRCRPDDNDIQPETALQLLLTVILLGWWWRWALLSPDGVASIGWSVCLRLLIFPCTIKFRNSVLAPAPRKRAVKRLWWRWWWLSFWELGSTRSEKQLHINWEQKQTSNVSYRRCPTARVLTRDSKMKSFCWPWYLSTVVT